uniref:Putative secreted protein n=1 Tax=Anopheles marajoara TaxID=58244 RepID=A0A2M4C821_9DIPT
MNERFVYIWFYLSACFFLTHPSQTEDDVPGGRCCRHPPIHRWWCGGISCTVAPHSTGRRDYLPLPYTVVTRYISWHLSLVHDLLAALTTDYGSLSCEWGGGRGLMVCD